MKLLLLVLLTGAGNEKNSKSSVTFSPSPVSDAGCDVSVESLLDIVLRLTFDSCSCFDASSFSTLSRLSCIGSALSGLTAIGCDIGSKNFSVSNTVIVGRGIRVRLIFIHLKFIVVN